MKPPNDTIMLCGKLITHQATAQLDPADKALCDTCRRAWKYQQMQRQLSAGRTRQG